MKRIKKKLVAVTLLMCMSYLMTDVCTVMASEQSNGGGNHTFVEDEQLSEAHEKIVFGKDEEGNAQEWYILERDDDHLVIVAAEPLKSEQVFRSDSKRNQKDAGLWADCVYTEVVSEVHPNHYGASDLRAKLKEMAAEGSKYFTDSELNLMLETEVTTFDTRNRVDYTTSDKLYALSSENGKLYAQGNNGKLEVTDIESEAWFWLRTPNLWMENKGDTLTANAENTETSVTVQFKRGILPATKIDLTKLAFASQLPSLGDGGLDDALTLRIDGSEATLGAGNAIGSVLYDKETENIKVTPNNRTVTLFVLGDDWYYSKDISSEEVVTKDMILAGMKRRAIFSLKDCQIWIEAKTDGITYAVMGTESAETIPTPSQPRNDNSGGDNKPGGNGSGTGSSSGSDKNESGKPVEVHPAPDKSTGTVTMIPANGTNANTGDSAPVIGLVILAVVSLAAVIYLKKKKGQNK